MINVIVFLLCTCMSETEADLRTASTPVVKLVTLGDLGTGKTTLCQTMCGQPSEIVTAPTLGIDFWSKIVHHNKSRMRLNAYDTSGQERFQALTPSYLRTADIILIVVSAMLSDASMATQLKTWYDVASKNAPNTVQYVVAITKRDLIDGTVVAGPQTCEQLMRCGLKRYHVVTGTMGFSGHGVHALWDDVVQCVINCCTARTKDRVLALQYTAARTIDNPSAQTRAKLCNDCC